MYHKNLFHGKHHHIMLLDDKNMSDQTLLFNMTHALFFIVFIKIQL